MGLPAEGRPRANVTGPRVSRSRGWVPGPLGFQPGVFTIPWERGVPPAPGSGSGALTDARAAREPRSAAEVRRGADRGEIAVERPGMVINMPMLTWPPGDDTNEGRVNETRPLGSVYTGRCLMTRTTAVLCAMIVVAWARPAHSGPITFLTALPVAQGQAVIRGQYLFIRATDDPTSADRELTVHGAPLAIAVGATPRMAIFAVVPIARKSMTISTPQGRITRESTGLGDIVAFARYTVYKVDAVDSTFRIAPFGGLQLPTGNTDRSVALGRLPRPLQPGSGSWDALGGVTITFQTKEWELDADAGFRKTTEAESFRFGDELFADLSFQYRVWPRQLGGGVPAFLFAVVETNLVSQGRHRIADIRDPDSGGTRWDVDLGLQYVTSSFILEGIVQVPVVDDPRGSGLRSDLRVTAGARWNVALPF